MGTIIVEAKQGRDSLWKYAFDEVACPTEKICSSVAPKISKLLTESNTNKDPIRSYWSNEHFWRVIFQDMVFKNNNKRTIPAMKLKGSYIKEIKEEVVETENFDLDDMLRGSADI